MDRSQDGSVEKTSPSRRLLMPVVHESLFVFVSTKGQDASGMALAEKWSFVLTKHTNKKSTSSYAMSNHSGKQMHKGITIDENYF